MTRAATFRGQPLLLLGGLLIGWTALRVVLWTPPFEAARDAVLEVPPVGAVAQAIGLAPPAPLEARAAAPRTWSGSPGSWRGVAGERALPAPALVPVWPQFRDATVPAPLIPAMPSQSRGSDPEVVIGHNLLLAAGLSRMQVLLTHLRAVGVLPPGVPTAAAPVQSAIDRSQARRESRWSADGWLMLRDDAADPILSGRPSYGRSQAGAVVRYNLSPGIPLRPSAHLRAGVALAGAREREVAAGVSARPLPALPVRVTLEARLGDTDAGSRVRPAAYAVTELAPAKLPLGVTGEAYLQAGYVGGAYATPFVDGQARAERTLLRAGSTELAAGAGAWGGAQKGAARLDVGPTASLSFRLGETRGRIAADYRWRVAGDAEPASGPAVTLSAGF